MYESSSRRRTIRTEMKFIGFVEDYESREFIQCYLRSSRSSPHLGASQWWFRLKEESQPTLLTPHVHVCQVQWTQNNWNLFFLPDHYDGECPLTSFSFGGPVSPRTLSSVGRPRCRRYTFVLSYRMSGCLSSRGSWNSYQSYLRNSLLETLLLCPSV